MAGLGKEGSARFFDALAAKMVAWFLVIHRRVRSTTMSVWAVIPLKSPESAKSRLSVALTAPQRLRLFYILARRVIETAVNTSGIAGVTVVTASDAVVSFATGLGADCLRVESDRGTAQACSAARNSLPFDHRERVLFLAGDIALISPSALVPLVNLATPNPHIAIAADRRRFGTNALLCAPGDAIPLCFGDNSFSQHIAAAEGLGIAAHIMQSDALALDIDEPNDLDEWRRRLVASGSPMDAELAELFAVGAEAVSQ